MAKTSRGYTDSLTAKYYGQLVARRPRNSTTSSARPSRSGIDYSPLAGNTPQGSQGSAAQKSTGGLFNQQFDKSNLPENLQNPTNPYDWFLQKASTPTNPLGDLVSAMSDPDKGVGKVVDVLSQPMYATVEGALDQAGETVKDGKITAGDILRAGVKNNPLNVLGRMGSANQKISPSDVLRGGDFLKEKYEQQTENSQGNDLSNNPNLARGLAKEGVLHEQDTDSTMQRVWKGVGGFAADVAMDPVSYIPGGAIKSVVTAPAKAGMKGLRAVGEAGREGNFASRLASDLDAFGSRFRKAPEVLSPEETVNRPLAQSGRADMPNNGFKAPEIAAGAPDMLGAQRRMQAPENVAKEVPGDIPTPTAAIPEAPPVGNSLVPTGEVIDPTLPRPFVPEDAAPKTGSPKVGRATPMMFNQTTREVQPWDPKIAAGEKVPKYSEPISTLWPEIKPKVDVAKAAETPAANPKGASKIEVAAARKATAKILPFEDFAKSIPVDKMPTPLANHIRNLKRARPGSDTHAKALSVLEKALGPAYSKYVNATRESAAQAPAITARAQGAEAQAVARQAASQARKAQKATASRRRISGAVLNSWIKKYQGVLEPDELKSLLEATDYKSFALRKKGIESKKVATGSDWQKFMMDVLKAEPMGEAPTIAQQIAGVVADVPENVYDASKVGLDTAAEQLSRAPEVPIPEMEAAVQRIREGKNLDEASVKSVRRALSDQEWDAIKPSQDFPFETDIQKSRRNSATPGEGRAVNRETVNRDVQRNIFGNLVDEATKAIPDDLAARIASRTDKKAYFDRARFMMGYILPRLQSIEEFFMAKGVYPTASSGKAGIPLTLSQVLNALYFSGSNSARQLVERGVFSAYDIAGKGVVDVDALLRISNHIADTVGEAVRSADDVTAAIAEAAKSWGSKMDKGKIRDALEGVNINPKTREVTRRGIAQKITKTSRVPLPAAKVDNFVDYVTEIFTKPNVIHPLLQFVHDNAAAAGIQTGRTVAQLSEDAIQGVLLTLDDMTGAAAFSDKVQVLTDLKKVVRSVAKTYSVTNEKKPNKVEIEAAQIKTEADISEVVPEIDVKNARTAKSASTEALTEKAGIPTGKMNSLQQGKYLDNVKSSLEESSLQTLASTDDVVDVAMQTGLFKMLDPLARTFAAHFGNATFHEALTKSGSVAGVYDRVYRHQLTAADDMAKKLAADRGAGATARDVWAEAFEAVQKGEVSNVPAVMKDFAIEVRKLVEPFFAGPRNGQTQSIISMFQREGFDLDHINFKLANPRFKFSEDIRLSKEEPSINGKKGAAYTNEAISQQWRDWKIEDPLDFLAKIQHIATELSTETSISREFQRLGTNARLISNKPRPGFVKVPRSLEGSQIARYLQGDATYMHPDVIPQMKRMDDLLARAGGRDNALGNFVRNNLDPLLSMWKSGMTIWRPGHHVRTLIGDLGMAFLVSGAKDPRYYLRALKIITQKQGDLGRTLRGSYGVWDAQAALQGFGSKIDMADLPSGSVGLKEELQRLGGVSGHMRGPAAKVKIGNKEYDLSGPEVQKGLMDRGVLPDFRKQEDIIDADNATGVVKAITDKAAIFDGRVRTKIGNFTEGRDDFIRIGHALHLLENGIEGSKFKSIDDAFDQVAAVIRKAHPDGTDLTPVERNVMRRIFPFYSWTRKAIPLVIENLVLHPGRFNAYPKAMYNFAHAAGVDLESMSEPFPEDQLFPKFLTEKMTGVGFEANDNYYSFDLGVPQADIANEFFAGGLPGFLGGVQGMLNPAIKTPIELDSGVNMATGAPINDKSDYIDGQIPGVNAFASITGISPSGTLANMLSGRGTIDQQYQVQKGNRGGILENPEYLINYLTGARVTDVSKPNYIKLAQIEERDRIAAEIRRNQELGWG